MNKNVQLSNGDIWLLLYVMMAFVTFAFGKDAEDMKAKVGVLQKKLHSQLFKNEEE